MSKPKGKSRRSCLELIAYADEHEAQLIVCGTKDIRQSLISLSEALPTAFHRPFRCANLVVKIPD
ncbi:MAG: hypothetical protein R3D26_12460 [Cyanobacteriota/Melainabacteria group bacterium]